MPQYPAGRVPSLSRRTLLRVAGTGAVVVGVAGVAACVPSRGSNDRGANAVPGGTAGSAFAPPPELRSSGGRLDLTLIASARMVPWGDGTRFALIYNGTVPGPTLRVRPGDVITLTLRNELDSATNLHTHGLHVSPEGTSDNVFVMVEPGQEFTYTYHLPTDHPSGTFWYHPHHHGQVASQLSGGLAGVIVVEDDLDQLPELAATDERVLVLSDPAIGDSASVVSAPMSEQMQGREGDVVLVNGELQPRIATTTGGVERWRLVNASASRYYRLRVADHPFHLIASEHGRLGQPVVVDDLLLVPGQRAEVLVAPTRAGSYVLSTASVDRGSMRMGGGMGGGGMGAGGGASATSAAADLLTLDVSGDPTGTPALPTQLRTITTPPRTDATRTLSLGAMGMGQGQFVIDGKAFQPGRIDTTARLGTTEEWTIRNDSMMDHPFHLHVWPFQVVARSGGQALDPGSKDTVNVPAGQSVTIRVTFADFAGTTVYHCHILDHEDLGMMGTIDVQQA